MIQEEQKTNKAKKNDQRTVKIKNLLWTINWKERSCGCQRKGKYQK